MPDWRNPDDYAYLERMLPRGWAWEFLRRSAEYRAAWAEWSEVQAALDTAPSVEVVLKRDALQARCYDFGLVLYRDPDRTVAEVGVSWVGETIMGNIRQGRQISQQTITWPGVPTKPALSLTFDRDHDYSAVETAMRALENLSFLPPPPSRRATIRFRPDDFQIYIRLLDAAKAGESTGEMGRVLFQGKADSWKSAKKALREAQKMAQARYKELLPIKPKRGGR